MFAGDSADKCAGKFSLVLMGGERRVSRAQTWERGPKSALAEILSQVFIAEKRRLRELRSRFMLAFKPTETKYYCDRAVHRCLHCQPISVALNETQAVTRIDKSYILSPKQCQQRG